MSWPEAFAPSAIRDVEEAVDWLADNAGSQVARRMALATVAAARRVVERPLVGRSRPEFLPPPYRFWTVGGFSYLLVYDAGARPPKILRVLHMARELEKALAGLPDVADEPPA